MRILLLNLYYPPDTSATAKMAHSVVDTISRSHDVTVLCGRPSYEPTERRSWRPYQTEIAGRARIIRAGSTDFPRLDMKKRVLNYLSYVALEIPRALLAPALGHDHPEAAPEGSHQRSPGVLRGYWDIG